MIRISCVKARILTSYLVDDKKKMSYSCTRFYVVRLYSVQWGPDIPASKIQSSSSEDKGFHLFTRMWLLIPIIPFTFYIFLTKRLLISNKAKKKSSSWGWGLFSLPRRCLSQKILCSAEDAARDWRKPQKASNLPSNKSREYSSSFHHRPSMPSPVSLMMTPTLKKRSKWTLIASKFDFHHQFTKQIEDVQSRRSGA